jgi:hypothetical protein
MSDYQVTHWRPDGPDRNRTIDRLKGPGWEDTPAKVAACIRGGHTFWVMSPLFGRVNLEAHGSWVKTSPNGYYDDNLYALPKF